MQTPAKKARELPQANGEIYFFDLLLLRFVLAIETTFAALPFSQSSQLGGRQRWNAPNCELLAKQV